MDRLTIRAPESTINENGVCCAHFHSEECKAWQGHCEQCSVNEAVWERLAQYEDTGAEPEAVAALMQLAAEKRLFVLPVAVGGEGWCVHATEEGKYVVMHGENVAPVLAWQKDGKWCVFSMDNVFPTRQAATEAICARIDQSNTSENIVHFPRKKAISHDAD